jgi:hypothetical protein
MQKTSFWELITSPDIKRICIPTIQRDYALGRRDKVFNRHNFLLALKRAVCTNEVLPLDFVYGVDKDIMFIPLDGQQRLTTLWLLHWYIAYKSGFLNKIDIKETLMKFSYETRISSTDFCKSLCALAPNTHNISLREWITQQTWFYHQYKQDPTIMGMLNMISGTEITDKKGNDIVDGLEEIFHDEECDYPGMWKRLTTTQCIQFNKLHISLNDSDELYVKMNARGKQLTDFENFKTELVQHVKDDNILGETEALNFAAKLDVDWTDIFWNNRWKDSREDGKIEDVSIDEIYFAFIRLYTRFECIKKYGDESDLHNKITKTFTSFDPYKKVLDKESIHNFQIIMDNLEKHSKSINEDSGTMLETQTPWSNLRGEHEPFHFVPKYKDNKRYEITEANNTEGLLFYGYCSYLLHGEYNKESFAEWNRVLWNICENRGDKSKFRPTISVIDMLAPCSHDIIRYLSQDFVANEKQANSEQLKEEQIKARHLDAYPLIREMEVYLFFKGAIRFLYTGADNKEDWSSFVTKANNIKKLIPEKREDRHTIKQLTPYISKQALCEIYFENWISNNDADLRSILLCDKAVPFLHNFLLQNNLKDNITMLHQDIMDLCEKAFGGSGYLQTKWNDGNYIWTNYLRGTKNHSRNSYVVGNEIYTRVSRLIDMSAIFEIDINQYQGRIGDHIQATYIHFKYHDCYFSLFGNNTICMMTNNWEEKMPNPDDQNGFYFSVQEIKTEEQLIEKVEEIISKNKA